MSWFLSIRMIWQRFISLLSSLNKFHDFFHQHSLEFDEPCIHHKDFLPKKNKGFCRKLHFLIKTNIQCLMSDISQRADKCTFQLIYFPLVYDWTEFKPVKAFWSFQGYISRYCFLQILEGIDTFYAVQWEASHRVQLSRMIHHFLALIQFTFFSCCGKIRRKKRRHFKLPTSLAFIIIINSFSQFSNDIFFSYDNFASSLHFRLKVNYSFYSIFHCN